MSSSGPAVSPAGDSQPRGFCRSCCANAPDLSDPGEARFLPLRSTKRWKLPIGGTARRSYMKRLFLVPAVGVAVMALAGSARAQSLGGWRDNDRTSYSLDERQSYYDAGR